MKEQLKDLIKTYEVFMDLAYRKGNDEKEEVYNRVICDLKNLIERA